MLKSESTKHVLTQTDNSYRKYRTLCNRIEMKTVESFDKHSIILLLPFFFYKNRLNLTEENEKQEPCRQHSEM